MSSASETSIADSDLSVVLASYARCRERGGFVKSFYRQLWGRDRTIAHHFHDTDMDRQEMIMREAINTLLMFAGGSVAARIGLERIASVHSRNDRAVLPELYSLFADVLVDTARVWDPRWDSALELRWRAVLGPGLAYMATRY